MSSETGAASQIPAETESQEPPGESRWPPAAALVVFMAFTVAVRPWLPGASEVRVPWLIPLLEAALLVAAGGSRLPPPRFHERHGVQPDGRDAAQPQAVRDAAAGERRALRTRGGAAVNALT